MDEQRPDQARYDSSRLRDGTQALEGRFDSAKGAAQAMEQLAEARIPTEQIEVYTLDRSGNRGRKVRVREGPGVKRGAIVGGAVGACVGLIAFVVVSVTGSFGVAEVATLTLTHAFYYVGAFAAAGIPLGAAIGMTASEGVRLSTPSSSGQSFVVVVRTSSLADEARRALQAAGATEVG
jgi:hypothetical protein